MVILERLEIVKVMITQVNVYKIISILKNDIN